MARIRNTARINFNEGAALTADWATVTHAGLVTTAIGAGTLLVPFDFAVFVATSGAKLGVLPRSLDFEIPDGALPEQEALLMMRTWLAARVGGLTMKSDFSDFNNANGTVYVALYTAEPVATDIETNELSADDNSGYSRVDVTIGNAEGTAANLRVVT